MDEHREEGHKTMPLPFSLKVLHQVLLALAHMHKRQMMHLDIKGQNLMFQVSYRDTILPHERAGHPAPMMVMKAPHVVLVDFGTARRMEEVKGEPIGTCAFMAPEVWKGCLSSKADVFSLGVVFFQMLAGKLPFNPPDTIDLAQEYWAMEPLPPWNEVPYTAPLCQEVCDSLLQVPQASRPQAEELLLHPLFADLHEHHPEEETVAIPTHYAQRLVNFAGKDVLQKCMRLRLARAWSSNQMPSFRRLFVALAPQGRLPPARLVAALSCSGLAERYGSAALVAQAAQQAADALVNEEGAISFTLFVAALADLGDPKYENFLLQSFEQVDHDDDSLLGIEDLAELLSADMKRHAVLLQEFMVALTGHASPGTKLEWRQFLRHFQSRDAAEAAPREASESPEAPDVAKGPDAFFQHFAGTLLDRAVEQMHRAEAKGEAHRDSLTDVWRFMEELQVLLMQDEVFRQSDLAFCSEPAIACVAMHRAGKPVLGYFGVHVAFMIHEGRDQKRLYGAFLELSQDERHSFATKAPYLSLQVYSHTSLKLPAIRPLSLYTQPVIYSGAESREVLLNRRPVPFWNRRLLMNSFAELNGFHFRFEVVERLADKSYSNWLSHRAGIYYPYDWLQTMGFYDWINMGLPTFVPDTPMYTYTMQGTNNRGWTSSIFEPPKEIYPYRYQDWEDLESRVFWWHMTDFKVLPCVQLFVSLPHLFLALSQVPMAALSAEMRLQHLQRTHSTARYWQEALLKALAHGQKGLGAPSELPLRSLESQGVG
ncbi:Calcium-dependent protein kinase 2 (PfCDPK2) [Durusdinium trenchii]|uniref:Calcium-dependent protein kinase 2 (PfCDPK2) n=1 Tax=Durusdinium trenchii TaxID=1381693 RepID=A0ABP0RDC6_9DINO